MTNRRANNNEPETTGEIHLRQTVQMTVADQTRTLEIAVTLPSGASADEIDRTIRQAEVGMRGITEQLDRQIAALKEPAMGQVIDAAHPHGNGALLNEPVQTRATPEPAPQPEPTPNPEPTPPPEATTAPAPDETTDKMTTAVFLKAAKALGYSSGEAIKALGVKSLTGVDLDEALTSLRALAAAPATRGFAEEIGPYDASPEQDPTANLTEPDELDEPDFGPVPEDAANETFAPEAEKPPVDSAAAAAQRRQDEAARRLRALRATRGAGPPATPEMRQVLFNTVISPLGNETAQALVTALWHPAPGEKLNAPRTRQLVEWSKEDDNFEETAALVIALARQPAPPDGE